jgi:hypothetical protein
LELILADPDSSGLAVLSVTGLGQVQADVNLTDLAGSDFHTVNSAKLTNRNIVFKVKYWGTDIEASRHIADKYFPVKKNITILVNTDHRQLVTTGMVEKNEPDIFSKASTGQISILCPDPFLYTVDDTSVPFGGIEPKFEFPFINEEISIQDENGFDTFEFGNFRLIKDKTIYYTGEAETGVTIVVNAIDTVRELVFYNLDTYQKIAFNDDIIASITGGQSISAGDRIVLSTAKTQKSVYLIRGGVVYNIINALGMPVDWFEIKRGDNIFTYSASQGEYDMDISIKYRIAYKGI